MGNLTLSSTGHINIQIITYKYCDMFCNGCNSLAATMNCNYTALSNIMINYPSACM